MPRRKSLRRFHRLAIKHNQQRAGEQPPGRYPVTVRRIDTQPPDQPTDDEHQDQDDQGDPESDA